MKCVVANTLASAFFGAMAADVVVDLTANPVYQSAMVGAIGYMGAMTCELLLAWCPPRGLDTTPLDLARSLFSSSKCEQTSSSCCADHKPPADRADA